MFERDGRPRPTGGTEAWQVVAVTVATVLVLGYAGWVALTVGGSTQEQTAPASATPEPRADAASSSPTTQPVQVVSVLCDGHASRVGSWFRRSVGAGEVEGATLGEVASFPDGDVATVRRGLPRVADSDIVIVQAGTEDIIEGNDPPEVADEVQDLVDAVADEGPVPVLALMPPSNDAPTSVLEGNDLLRAWAQENEVRLLDLHSAVSAPGGTWGEGLGADNRYASAEGSRVLAEVAARRLTQIVDNVA